MAFIVASAVCGALSVPWDPISTAVAGVVGGLMATLALWVRRWARLPDVIRRPATARPGARLQDIAIWFGVGLAVGLVLLAVIRLVIEPVLPAAGARIAAAGQLPVWRRLLIIYVAAVGEELLFRVLLLSLVAGVLVRLIGRTDRLPTTVVLTTAMVIASLVFAAAHLQAWSSIGLSAGVVVTVMALNSLGGLVFGYAFVTRGIVAAVFAHAGGDVAIQLIGPFTGS
jgi:hypothetical protein